MKHFLKLLDVTTEEIYELLDLAAVMKQYVKEGKEHHLQSLRSWYDSVIFNIAHTYTLQSLDNRDCRIVLLRHQFLD